MHVLLVERSAAFDHYPYDRAKEVEEIFARTYGDQQGEGLRAWAKLALVCLSSSNPDSVLGDLIEALRGMSALTTNRLSAALDAALEACKETYSESWAESDRVAAMLDEQAASDPEDGFYRDLRDFFSRYREVSKAVQKDLLRTDFSVYTDALGVFEPRDGWPQPTISFSTPYTNRAPVVPIHHAVSRPGVVYRRSLDGTLAKLFVTPMDLDIGYQPFPQGVVDSIEAWSSVGEALTSGTVSPIVMAHLTAYAAEYGQEVVFEPW